ACSMSLEDYKKIVSFAIFPALNVARVGNSDEYYVCSEIPGVYVGKGNETFSFKEGGKVKPQAARFRVYGYDKDGTLVREIKLTDADANKGLDIKITWTVELANKKAAHTQFSGILEYKESNPKRNADWPYGRSTLEAIKKETLSSSEEEKVKELEAHVYRHGNDENSGRKLFLGKIILENSGSLIVIGGKGESGSVKDDVLITHYANNDYWYDDTSDGSIDATINIKINGNSPPQPLEQKEDKSWDLKNLEGKSWVLVAPPKFAPGIANLVPLYQVISETQHPVDPENPINPNVVFDLDNPAKPNDQKNSINYYRDIRPIFEAVCRASWVNKMAFRGHGLYKQGDFLNPDLEGHLKNPNDCDKDLRKNVLSRVRIPKYLASPAEFNGQAYGYFMPPLSGNDGDTTPTAPDTYLTVTRGQYILLQRWADGDFETGNQPKEYYYRFDAKDKDGIYPQYSEDGEKYMKFEEVVPDVHNQIKCLNKAALQWCVGGAFYPGIEMTFVSYDKNTFNEKYDFRINSKKISPGDINAFMALPWQADFYECNTHWWPAQRPDIVIPEDQKDDVEKYGVNLSYFEDWTRGFRTDEPQRGMPKWGDMDMVEKWHKLGFIVEKQLDGDIKKAFFEVEREQLFALDINSVKSNLDNLYEMLKIAMMIELTTIPPYLYAIYSIKPGTEIGDELRRQIRHIAATFVTWRQPIFYSREMTPFFPNPLPHIKQGSITVHLSKANKATLENFANIEKPDDKINSDENSKKSDEFGAESIGDLYEKIENMFTELDKQIKYDKLFQLGPGMGYAPSTSDKNEGLIIVDCLSAAKKAIEVIIDQGEGGGCNTKDLEAEINVKVSGEIKVGNKVKIRGTIKATLKGTKKGKITENKNGSIKGTIDVTSYDDDDNSITGKIYGKINGEINGIITSGTVTGKIEEMEKEIHGIKEISKGICGKITEGIYDESHYARFNYCVSEVEIASESDYQLWPVVDDPNFVSYTNPHSQETESYADPNVVTTLIAFNAAYSYLMLLLQVVWRTDGQKKKTLIMGGMPALMHGVLKPIATFLAKTSVTSDLNAGSTFGFYQFENTSSPKDQLKKVIEEAAKAFSYSDELKNAVTAVDALPDVSQEIFVTL
ncbi:4483_t:CDS:10, partial [Cetraspora pellucida]